MGAETLSESLWLPMRLTFSHGRFPVQVGTLTALSFVVGALTSILAGYIGMMVAVYSNARTTVSAKKEGEDGWVAAFNVAFRAGGVMGYVLALQAYKERESTTLLHSGAAEDTQCSLNWRYTSYARHTDTW